MRNFLFWIAFPFLLPQALYVRQTAPRFAPAAGPTTGSAGAGDPLQLLAIGDSIIAGVGTASLESALVGQTAVALAREKQCRIEWQALGVSGYNSEKVLEHLVPKLPAHSVDFIIVSMGVNDVTGLTSIRRWRCNLTAVIKALSTHSPNASIAIAGLPPLHHFPLLPQPLRSVLGMRARLFDDIARTIIDRSENTVHVPIDFEPEAGQFSDDGFHPSTDAYVEFGQSMADGLQ